MFQGDLARAAKQIHGAVCCAAGGGAGEKSDGDDDMFADSGDDEQPAPETAAVPASGERTVANSSVAPFAAEDQREKQAKPAVGPPAGEIPTMPTDTTPVSVSC